MVMTTRPGYIWSGTEWVAIGQEAVVAPVSYQTSAPSTPSTGDIWIDSNDDVPGIDTSQFLRWRKTVSGGETSVSGTDDTGLTLAYTAGYEQVYLNGVLLVRGQDYTATNGTSITGLTALAASDVVEVFGVVARVVGDTYTQSQITTYLAGKSDVTSTGLVLITSATIGSAVSSVTISNCFSSSYDNYRIIISNSDASADAFMRIKYNNSNGSTYKYCILYAPFTATSYTSIGASASNGTTSAIVGITGLDNNTNISFDVLSPYLAQYTSHTNTSASTYLANTCSGYDANAVSHTGITILPESGTITGGTIKVYGYK
jgi:hypothetical protein